MTEDKKPGTEAEKQGSEQAAFYTSLEESRVPPCALAAVGRAGSFAMMDASKLIDEPLEKLKLTLLGEVALMAATLDYQALGFACLKCDLLAHCKSTGAAYAKEFQKEYGQEEKRKAVARDN